MKILRYRGVLSTSQFILDNNVIRINKDVNLKAGTTLDGNIQVLAPFDGPVFSVGFGVRSLDESLLGYKIYSIKEFKDHYAVFITNNEELIDILIESSKEKVKANVPEYCFEESINKMQEPVSNDFIRIKRKS